MDLSLFSHDVAAQAPQVAAVCKPIIKTVTKIVPQLVGVKLMTAIISTSVAFVIGGGLGWYLKSRKVTSAQTAVDSAKIDVEAFKKSILDAAKDKASEPTVA